LVDERLTSHAAGQSLAEAGVRGRRQKGMLDQVAAQHILETFFTASYGAA
jgi:putative Holliday junction resolvase